MLDLAKYDDIDFSPPEGVRAAYRNGLQRHENGETGDGMEPATIAQARRFADGEPASPEWARKGNRWWGRNARFADEEPGTPAYAAAQLWGGRNWFASLVASMDKRDSEMSDTFDIVDSTQLLTHFQFVELEALKGGKPFDGFSVGEFVDMYGRAVKVTASELPTFLKNTLAALESTRGESGELAGLPIDAKNHDKGDGAGYIVGVELQGNLLRMTPAWTEIGLDIIGKKIRRWFSATVDLANKVIVGGTLTNYPATRNKNGQIMLRPIELSQDLLQVETQATAENETPDQPVKPKMENKIMTVELTQEVQDLISAKIAEGVKAALDAQPKQEAKVDLSQLVEAFGLNTEKAEEQGLNHLNELARQVEAQVNLRWQNILAEKQRENRYTELATKVTGGTTEYPRALPVTADNLKAALLKLPTEQAGFWMNLCETIVKTGLTEFSELGHGKKVTGTNALPADIAAQLDSGALTLTDLSSPILAPALGDLAAYDLSKWSK